MGDVVAASAALISAALRGVAGVGHYRQMSGPVDPPATVLPPPALTWSYGGSDPSDASWTVALVVGRHDRAVEQLLSLLPRVVEAVDGLDGRVVVKDARPGTYPAGGLELPAYLISIDVCL